MKRVYLPPHCEFAILERERKFNKKMDEIDSKIRR